MCLLTFRAAQSAACWLLHTSTAKASSRWKLSLCYRSGSGRPKPHEACQALPLLAPMLAYNVQPVLMGSPQSISGRPPGSCSCLAGRRRRPPGGSQTACRATSGPHGSLRSHPCLRRWPSIPSALGSTTLSCQHARHAGDVHTLSILVCSRHEEGQLRGRLWCCGRLQHRICVALSSTVQRQAGDCCPRGTPSKL